MTTIIYRVRQGDTLSEIARRNRCSVESLRRANNLMQSGCIRVGQELCIPQLPVTTPRPGTNATIQGKGHLVAHKTAAKLPPKPTPGESQSTLETIWDWLWGTLQGDFNKDPSVSQIAVNTVLGLIPVMDQALDLRDIIAGLKDIITYYMEDEQERKHHPGTLGLSYEVWLWLGLFIIAIGCIPEVGSVVKGVLKVLISFLHDVGKKVDALSPKQVQELWQDMVKALNRFGIEERRASNWLKQLPVKLTAWMNTASARIKLALDAIQRSLIWAEQITNSRAARSALDSRQLNQFLTSIRRIKRALQTAYARLDAMKTQVNQWLREQLVRLLPPNKQCLLDELKARGIKHDPNAVIRIAKDRTGRIVFLEKGMKSAETTRPAGLAHIVEEHGDDFARVGVSEAEIPDLVMRAATEGKVVGTQGRPPGRPIHEIAHKGKRLHIAVTVSRNGYIVGANPTSLR